MSLTVTPSLLAPRRMLLALLVAAIALTCLPQVAEAAPFGVQKLRQGGSTGPENYVYTDGGVVFGQASVADAEGGVLFGGCRGTARHRVDTQHVVGVPDVAIGVVV